jgi:hypothetical protein
MLVIGNRKKIESLISHMPISVNVLSHSYGNKIQVFLKRMLKVFGVKMGYVQHGTFEIQNSFYSGKKDIIEFERIESVRYSFERILYELLEKENYEVYPFKFKEKFSNKKGLNVKIKKIGITIANDAFKLEEEQATLRGLYVRVVDYFSSRNIECVKRDRNQQLAFLELSEAKDESFEGFLGRIDLLITTKSTICYEAAEYGIPVVILNANVAPIYLPSVAIMSPGCSMSYLDSVLFDEKYLSTAIKYQSAVNKALRL